MARPFHARRLGATLLALAALVIVAVPAATAVEGGKVPEAFLEHLSQSVSANYWARHPAEAPDRKSTRLNSSHRCISYAVFCLKKKKKKKKTTNSSEST